MKILAIASCGGHWVQLLRLMPALDVDELIFMSTKECFADTVKGHRYFTVPDGNRWQKIKLLQAAFKIAKIIYIIRPQIVVTTGAAPGLIGIIAGRVFGSKTVWIDSIANSERISMSGRIALLFASRVYTQWPHLSSSKVIYNRSILS